jgi:hypothetical protein
VITLDALVRAMMAAFVLRMSGLREIAQRLNSTLGTDNFSSLCPALRRKSAAAFVRRLLSRLEDCSAPRRADLIAIDGMALTLPKTQRHRCKKFNDKTVGGGVVWSYRIDARKGSCPVRLLATIQGAWHDSRVMRGVALVAQGPVYLMDRGFYAFELLDRWMTERVRFIVRARRRSLVYTVLRVLSPPRRYGSLEIVEDAWVRLGGAQARLHPEVRLITARLATGELLTLVTSERQWSAEAVLDAYKKRWHIERFHKFLKQTLGLAHLYSFAWSGMEFLLLTALLLAMTLLEARPTAAGMVIDTLHGALGQLRRLAGLFSTWRRNTIGAKHAKRKARNC